MRKVNRIHPSWLASSAPIMSRKGTSSKPGFVVACAGGSDQPQKHDDCNSKDDEETKNVRLRHGQPGP